MMGDPVRKLCSDGGLAVAFETVGTLHQCAYQERAIESDGQDLLQWEVIAYGIPVIMANENGIALCLADVESGDKLCSFTISEASQYTVFNEDFHIFSKPSGCFGVGFSNPSVGSKLFACLKRIVSSIDTVEGGDNGTEENEGIEPAPGEASSDEEEPDFGGVEPDGIIRKKSVKRKKLMEISSPQEFRHVSHVGTDASVLELSQILSWKGTLEKKERITSQVISIPRSSNKQESGTEVSTSFEEVKKVPSPPAAAAPPPPPPPPAVVPPPPTLEFKKKKDSSLPADAGKKDLNSSLIDEIKKGVVLRPVNGDRTSRGSQERDRNYSSIQEELKNGFVLKTRNHTMTLPMPPRRKETEQLIFEIKTFRRKKLRDISMTDFPARAAPVDDNSLESILKKRLEAMFHKISDAVEFTNTGTVNSTGEDTFDGVLFSDS